MPFVGREIRPAPPESPEVLFRELPRTGRGVSELWIHQGDVLRAYRERHVDTPDVAIELPTGTGKTLPGLLIADWCRRFHGERAAYAAPTRQLARQVVQAAEREGIPAVLLVGGHGSWATADVTRYDGALAVAVTTYSTVFNSNPHLVEPRLLLFDDAHAGEQYVSEAYAVPISMERDPDIYNALLTVLSPELPRMFLKRLGDPTGDPGVRQETKLVVPLRDPSLITAIDDVLFVPTASEELRFRYAMVRGHLPACLVYVAWHQVLIRPFVPPTFENRIFAQARQRIYLSATLGEGGELERAFGRTPIVRLPLLGTSGAPRSGRRFFIFPDLAEGADPDDLTREVVSQAGKALVLTPDNVSARTYAENLAPAGWPILGRDDVSESLEPLARAEHAVCGLANRYDGLDLPDQACRLVILADLPSAQNLQERFLATRVGAQAALAERVRTRVIQGGGRCARGPQDWSLVAVLGAEIASYLSRPEVRQAMDPELQAEIEFGLGNARGKSAEVLENVGIFLEHGDAWRDGAEPRLAEFRAGVIRQRPDGTDELASSVQSEIEACMLAWHGRFEAASTSAQGVARVLGRSEATRPYRAFWLYLSALWLYEAGRTKPVLQAAARDLLRQASEAARPATWIRDMAPLPDDVPQEIEPEDRAAVEQICARLEKGVNRGTHDGIVGGMLAGLAAADPSRYEPALTELGRLLGADAFKPPGEGGCDSAWCWGNHLWIALEAKSDQNPDGPVSLDNVRQANTALPLLAGHRSLEVPPFGSITVVISPRGTVAPTAVIAAEPQLHLATPELIAQLGADATEAWQKLLTQTPGLTARDLREVTMGVLSAHSALPSQVRDRLTPHPIRGL